MPIRHSVQMAVYDKTVLAGQTNVINVVAVLTLSNFHSFFFKVV